MTGLHSKWAHLPPELEITVSQAVDAVAAGALFVDVREREEFTLEHIDGSVFLPSGRLELDVETEIPERTRALVVVCASGTRSLLAAARLRELGYEATSMRGGLTAWRAQDRALRHDDPDLTPEQVERYSRHLKLASIGRAGQIRLLRARVLLVGAGGLGSPAALYLAAAGVGHLGIVDDDVVDRSNLQRQVLHSEATLGQLKVDSAHAAIQALNPDVVVRRVAERLTRDNVDRIFEGYDVVIDGGDNFATRYLVNDAALKHRIPLVHGSVHRFEGQVTVILPGKGPCYRCLYPDPPGSGEAPSCAEAGVLGVVPGLVGMMQATEAIKVLLGLGNPLVGTLAVYDALDATVRHLRLAADPACAVCHLPPEAITYADHAKFCGP